MFFLTKQIEKYLGSSLLISKFSMILNESLKIIWRTFFLYFCCNLTNFKRQTFTLQFIQHDSFYFCLFFRRNKCFFLNGNWQHDRISISGFFFVIVINVFYFHEFFFLSIQKRFEPAFQIIFPFIHIWLTILKDRSKRSSSWDKCNSRDDSDIFLFNLYWFLCDFNLCFFPIFSVDFFLIII